MSLTLRNRLRNESPPTALKFRRRFWLMVLLYVAFPHTTYAFQMLLQTDVPYQLNENYLVAEGDTLVIGKGVTIQFAANSNLIVEGTLFVFGTAKAPVRMQSLADSTSGMVKMRGPGGVMRHVQMDDIRIEASKSNLALQHVVFLRKEKLQWSENTLLVKQGNLFVDHCAIWGNGSGEGILVVNGIGKITVQNSYFFAVQDAVEFISVDSGAISGNRFAGKHSKDDAIDINNCKAIQVAFNSIAGFQDRAIEIGHDNFGSSSDIYIRGNFVHRCRIGITVKEGSTASMRFNHFRSTDIAVQCAETVAGRGPASISVRNCWFSDTREQVFQEWDVSTIDQKWNMVLESTPVK